MCDSAKETGWDVDYQQVDSGTFDATFSAVVGNQFLIADEFFNRSLIMCGTPPPETVSIILNWGTRDRGVFQGKRVALHDALFMRSSDEGILSLPANIHTMTLSVSRERLAGTLWAYDRRELSNHLTESSAVPFSPAVIRDLREAISEAFESAGGPGTEQRVEDTILHLIAQGLTEEVCQAKTPLRSRNRHRCVRTAKDYIDSRLADDFGVSDVAIATGVSVRTMQSAFLDVVGVRPVEFIRSRRLSKTRIALLNPHRREETIGKIAAAHGLHHQGIFSRDYKVLFGELPSETARANASRLARSPA